MNILDNGLDKPHDTFLHELTKIMTPIRESPTSNTIIEKGKVSNKPITNFIVSNDGFKKRR